ncbi:hypothetical protein FB451DRAFT_1374433 [Mycena latifolia]|nr:hypothetical protein FB451DRAFT_1374433 [Mycena latifolia]
MTTVVSFARTASSPPQPEPLTFNTLVASAHPRRPLSAPRPSRRLYVRRPRLPSAAAASPVAPARPVRRRALRRLGSVERHFGLHATCPSLSYSARARRRSREFDSVGIAPRRRALWRHAATDLRRRRVRRLGSPCAERGRSRRTSAPPPTPPHTRAAGYTSINAAGELEDDSELDLDLEEEEEALAAALETSVRELALGDWARGRILEDAWVAPADVYHNVRVGAWMALMILLRRCRAWAVSPPSSPSPSPSAQPLPGADDAPAAHPGAPAPSPPTYVLAEAAHNAHVHQMLAVLLPAFCNVVRRVIVECSLDAAQAPSSVPGGARRVGPLDPAVRAARMGLADVVREFDGSIGGSVGGMHGRRRMRGGWTWRRRGRAEAPRGEEGSDDSSEGTSRTSDTSPVLSSSTLWTRLSPPPLGEHRADKDKDAARDREKEAEDVARERQPTIAVMPVLAPLRLLRPIPYVPETSRTCRHTASRRCEPLVPSSSPRAGMLADVTCQVWREACAPLYHCRCSICDRAMAVAQAAQGGNPAAASAATTTRASVPEHTHAHNAHSDGPIVVHLPAEDDSGGRGANQRGIARRGGRRRVIPAQGLRGRGRGRAGRGDQRAGGVLEADGRAGGPGRVRARDGADRGDARGRLVSDDDEYSEEGGEWDGAGSKYALSPGATGEREYTTVRLVKRRSEELDAEVTDATDAATASAGSAPNRARLEAAESPPDTSTPGSGEESAYEATTYARVALEDAPPTAK